MTISRCWSSVGCCLGFWNVSVSLLDWLSQFDGQSLILCLFSQSSPDLTCVSWDQLSRDIMFGWVLTLTSEYNTAWNMNVNAPGPIVSFCVRIMLMPHWLFATVIVILFTDSFIAFQFTPNERKDSSVVSKSRTKALHVKGSLPLAIGVSLLIPAH